MFSLTFLIVSEKFLYLLDTWERGKGTFAPPCLPGPPPPQPAQGHSRAILVVSACGVLLQGVSLWY